MLDMLLLNVVQKMLRKGVWCGDGIRRQGASTEKSSQTRRWGWGPQPCVSDPLTVSLTREVEDKDDELEGASHTPFRATCVLD